METINVNFNGPERNLQNEFVKCIESRKKKIYTYWKKICDDEKIASSRNSMLLIELEKLDNHLAFMKQQTQKMDFFKQQYADSVARVYPEWTKMVEHKMKENKISLTTDAYQYSTPRCQLNQTGEIMQTQSEQQPQVIDQVSNVNVKDSIASVSTQCPCLNGSLFPELTIDGFVTCLQYIEADLANKLCASVYYSSPVFDRDEKLSVIQRANNGDSLLTYSCSKVSDVVLEQIPFLVRSTAKRSLITDDLLQTPLDNVTASTVRDSLTGNAQILWDVIFAHLVKLVKSGVFEDNELAAVFVPCLVSDGFAHQDLAFKLLVNLLSSAIEDVDKSFNVNHNKATNNASANNSPCKQPVLETLSTTCRKPTSMLTGETDYYVNQHMTPPLTSSSPIQPVVNPYVEKLSIRLKNCDGIKDDLPKDDIPELPVFSSPNAEKKLTATDLYTGHRRRQGVLCLGSDFDTDSEVDVRICEKGTKATYDDNDDDDFDFYD